TYRGIRPTSASSPKTEVMAADATVDAGSAALPIHWSTATPTLSITHMVRIDPTRRYPHGRRRQRQKAATAIRGSHHGGVLLNTEGTMLRSQTRAFNATIARA